MARILVVDDEEQIRKMLSTLLVEGGHEVQAASNAQEAVALCASRSFDLVLSDVLMPDVDGHHLVHRISGVCPQIRVILMSGFNIDCDVCPYVQQCRIVSKPFRSQDLLTIIAQTIAAPPPSQKPAPSD